MRSSSSCCLCRIFDYRSDVPFHAAVLELDSLQLLASNELAAFVVTDSKGKRILDMPWHLFYGKDHKAIFSHLLPKR